ncbi:hypothetical protein HNR23_003521 [Nocardiopsis mwathae]|uniref:Uncharacterized protein n=1 Tax=Nocardiopsis mwathae TaxID=1472723 RepID=A0A7W9YKZ3_9ACTN|nr:hypothetical protein [Nocardiopsis mwathae]MBB6173461.1 hypothetical protein [Nocardiopsis mwathae]
MKSALVLAQTDVDLDVDAITPGVLGFIVIALIAFCLYLLMKSMTRKLGGVKGKEFDPEDAKAEEARPEEAQPEKREEPGGEGPKDESGPDDRKP